MNGGERRISRNRDWHSYRHPATRVEFKSFIDQCRLIADRRHTRDNAGRVGNVRGLRSTLLKRVENSLWKLENKNDVRLEIISFFSACIFDSMKLRRKYFIYIRSLVSISVKFDKIDIFINSYIHLFREYLVSFFKSWFETEEIIHILIQCKISFLIRVCLYCTYVYFYEILLI